MFWNTPLTSYVLSASSLVFVAPVILQKRNDQPVTPFSTGLAKNVKIGRDSTYSDSTLRFLSDFN